MKETISPSKKLEYNKKYYQKHKEKIKLDQRRRWKEYQEEMRQIKLKLKKIMINNQYTIHSDKKWREEDAARN